MKYVDVILPLKLPWCPVYASDDNVLAGDRVRVKFAGREYDGVVWHTDVTPSVNPEKVSPISAADTGLIRITARELRFWEFISNYYLCSIGEVYKTAYPESRIRSEKIALTQKERAESSRTRRREALERRVATLRQRLETKKDALSQRLSKELTSTRIRKNSGIADNLRSGIQKIEDELLRTLEALEAESSATGSPVQSTGGNTNHQEPTDTISCAIKDATLPAIQSAANCTQIPSKPLVLVSSDRINFYIRAIRSALNRGRQVLVLAPEKAFISRLANEIGQSFSGLVHGFSSNDTALSRRKVADKSRTDNIIILGTRSSLFLPFRDLGLIIIDEEQDSFYKQTEPNPRYHGRDAAMALAAIHGAEVVLGTGSPSLETWYNCSVGKYRMQHEPVRDDAVTIDINAERHKNGMVGPVSRKLLQAISRTEGPSLIIRGWENPEDLDFRKLCPGKTVRVMTMQEFKRESCEDTSLIGVLQADAFVRKDDFRADERASQLVVQMSSLARKVMIQTSVPERFTGSRKPEELLAERKTFHYPPFSRIIDINVEDKSEKRLSFICSRIAGRLGSDPLTTGPGQRKFRLFLEKGTTLTQKKHDIADTIARIAKEFKYPGHIIMDVDPQ